MLLHTLLIFSLLSNVFSASGPLTKDFQNWLNSNGYESDDFVRSDYGNQGSFGGFSDSGQNISNTPVIFIHGNSDSALQTDSFSTGWQNSYEYFLENGYTTAELYATSWQDNVAMKAATRTHNCHDIQRLRRFVEAVLAYTKAPKVSIIGHSMGVTLARKIIKGGPLSGKDGNCNIGTSLNRKIEVLVGISGANYGLCNCEGTAATFEKTCNKENGFWPGDSCGLNYYTCGIHPLPWPCSSVTSYSTLLMQMNTDNVKEADYVYSVWSHADDLIQYNDLVWGKPTSLIPTSDAKHEYPKYTHMQTKEKTAADQYNMVKNKQIPT